MIKLVVFDMAGTTVDEDNVVYKTVRAAINAAGYNFTQDQVQLAGAGKEKSQAIRDTLALDGGAHSDQEVDLIFQDFKDRLKTAYQDLQVTEQPGAAELFRQLKANGVGVVLNTGYDRNTAEGLLDKIGWQIGDQIDGLVTASDVVNGRPHPEMIQQAMSQVGVNDPAAVAKIGDSQIDIEEGRNANCGMTLGITTGAQTREQLAEAKPTHIVDELLEILPFIGVL